MREHSFTEFDFEVSMISPSCGRVFVVHMIEAEHPLLEGLSKRVVR